MECAVSEVGCGNGLISAVVARNEARLHELHAVDVSLSAVECTYRNVYSQRQLADGQYIGDRASYTVGKFATPACNGPFDLALSNPPYVPIPDALGTRGGTQQRPTELLCWNSSSPTATTSWATARCISSCRTSQRARSPVRSQAATAKTQSRGAVYLFRSRASIFRLAEHISSFFDVVGSGRKRMRALAHHHEIRIVRISRVRTNWHEVGLSSCAALSRPLRQIRGQTIQFHQQEIASYEQCWWGWWGREHEPLPDGIHDLVAIPGPIALLNTDGLSGRIADNARKCDSRMCHSFHLLRENAQLLQRSAIARRGFA